jgi:hypothetical protein
LTVAIKGQGVVIKKPAVAIKELRVIIKKPGVAIKMT